MSIKEELNNLLEYSLIQDPLKLAAVLFIGIILSNFFTNVTSDIVKPLVNLITTPISMSGLNFKIRGIEFKMNDIISQTVIFIILITLFYLLIVVPIKRLNRKYHLEKSKCPYCKSLIVKTSTRCSSCAANLSEDWSSNNKQINY